MATSAAIHNQATGRAVYVGTSGDPDRVQENLARIIDDGRLDALFEHSDYYTIYDLPAAIDELRVEGVGILLEDQAGEMTVIEDPHTHAPLFYDGAAPVRVDYKYSITPDRQIIVHHKY